MSTAGVVKALWLPSFGSSQRWLKLAARGVRFGGLGVEVELELEGKEELAAPVQRVCSWPPRVLCDLCDSLTCHRAALAVLNKCSPN